MRSEEGLVTTIMWSYEVFSGLLDLHRGNLNQQNVSRIVLLHFAVFKTSFLRVKFDYCYKSCLCLYISVNTDSFICMVDSQNSNIKYVDVEHKRRPVWHPVPLELLK